ncbi:MAG: hypothetical protein M3T96_02020 [Acidobacteriota bacterium]|nr:hypothetical protein [Acidobacteriota bacterium]
MKVNKSKSPYVSGADTPDEKDIAKAVKGEKFADALAALDAGGISGGDALNATRATLAQIASQSDLNSDDGISSALRQSAELLVKSRLGEKFKDSEQSEKAVRDLSDFVSDDPFFKTKLLSVLHKLRDE